MARLAAGDPSLPWSVSLSDFPHPSLASTSAVGRFAPTFLLASVVINFVILLTNMVTERETGTRSALTAMGLRDSAHWVSWVVPELLLTCAHSAVLLGSLVAMRFPLALRNSPALLFLLLWGSELSMAGVALVFSALLRRSASAVPAGFATYIVCWALQLVVQFGFPYRPGVAEGWVGFFSCLPPCLLTKGLQDLANAALGSGPGISWRHRTEYCWEFVPSPAVRTTLPYWQSDCIVPVGQAVWLLPLQASGIEPEIEPSGRGCTERAAGYLLIAVYLDGVLPREAGTGWGPLWGPLLQLLPGGLRLGLLGSGERGRRARSARRASAALERSTLDQQHQQLLLQLQQQQQPQSQVLLLAPPPHRAMEALSYPGILPYHQEAPAVAGTEGDAVNDVQSAGLYGLQAGRTDPGVTAETAVVQSICRRFVEDVRQATAAPPPSPTAEAICNAAFGGIGPVEDSLFSGGGGAAAAAATSYLGARAPATATAAVDAGTGGLYGKVHGGVPDWREGVVLFGLRKEYGSRGWVAAVAGWCCGWLRRRRRQWQPAAVAGAAGAFGTPPTPPPTTPLPLPLSPPGKSGSEPDRLRAGGGGGGVHVAVYGTWLHIVPGECFCLLGPNGAGKTTTIKSLVGAIRPTSGEALVYGTSVLDPAGLDAARSLTGICPQFDVLWGALSGREHLALMADVRGLPWGQRRGEVERMLQQVRLEAAADRPAGSYSGGMRRRLSVAAALLGDPRVVYLDEPTTGMDPVSRSHVWELISASKAGRCLVLTTHSMEEAEVLGDRIAILAAGRLRCLGHSLALKRRYGGGYRLSVGLRELAMPLQGGEAVRGGEGLQGGEGSIPAGGSSGDIGVGGGGSGAGWRWGEAEAAGGASGSGRYGGPYGADGGGGGAGGCTAETAEAAAASAAAALERLVTESLGLSGGVVAERGRSHLHFQVPREAETRLPLLFERLQVRLQANGRALGVVDVQIKLSSLEDVYLEVVRQWR
ncbi:hypothetical protein PLESTF_001033400 [Pleodorina starrii]|nr:hypothetical protein PLESTF_001033400 [Pleodorina starrii]